MFQPVIALTRFLTLAAVLCVAFAGAVEAQGRKLALVVGNEAYQGLAPLSTPVADASGMARSLRGLGFEVTLLTDVGPEVFQAVLETFARQSASAETVLFYYSGHAFQNGGVNYLVPVTATAGDAAALMAQTWALDDITAQLQGGAAQVLVFLDACRDMPLAEGVTGGLAPFDGGAGSFVAFATAPGQVAWDRIEGAANSPFTAALLNHIAEPDQSISDLMIKVRNEVVDATGGKQTPWDQSSLRAQFSFVQTAPQEDALPEFEIAEASGATIGAPVETMAKSVLTAVQGGDVVRLAALDSQTRSLARLNEVAAALPHIDGLDPTGNTPATPENLALAVQGELKRIGCYGMSVDGDWGNGSRNAMRAYYKAKKADAGEVEPTEAVWRALLTEPEKTCDTPVVAQKKAAPKAATKKTTTTKKAAAEPAPAPKKDGVTCKFMVIAVVCN